MKTSFKLSVLIALALTFAGIARAANLDGKWKAEFDSQIGKQTYVFEIKTDGEKFTGKISRDAQGQKSEFELKEGKITKDEVSFVEALKIQDQELRIEYKGKIVGDELKLHRKVGEIAEYDIVAKRVPEQKR